VPVCFLYILFISCFTAFEVIHYLFQLQIQCIKGCEIGYTSIGPPTCIFQSFFHLIPFTLLVSHRASHTSLLPSTGVFNNATGVMFPAVVTYCQNSFSFSIQGCHSRNQLYTYSPSGWIFTLHYSYSIFMFKKKSPQLLYNQSPCSESCQPC
jgi:hypothetical protein